MNANAEPKRYSQIRFSLRFLFALTLLTALFLVLFSQHRQNRELQLRLDAVSSQLEELRSANDEMRLRHEKVEEFVRNPPVQFLPLATR
ncbi:hypothetical protein K227x_62080 [Rubripirellula lacrimiformis]|uniref:Uncharacterized protein n=1 Tax=Rubripirellula lacrimiformis TaxID=1930273 RepID=A0A517NKX4_9BACT|nr:hypothetical protein K227x_62080 [Rubripirellula lacrimiformis]